MDPLQDLLDYFGNNVGHLLFLLGFVIILMSLLRQLGQRMRQNLEKKQQHEAAVKAAQEAERQNMSHGILPKAKVTTPKNYLPLQGGPATPFTGAIHGQAAKWEMEIHQLGRQIIGQIDSKMAALQAITLDANRAANRLEILVEHLEQIAQKQIQTHQPEAASQEVPPAVIPATESVTEAVAPLADVLQELTDDIADLRKTMKHQSTFSDFMEQAQQATVLRMEEVESQNLRREVEMLSNYGLKPQEIAQRLNITPGEVYLILQVVQSHSV